MNEIADSFAIVGDVISVEPYGEGHINRTYLITTDNVRYILQKIIDKVFGDIDGLMNNIVAVTEFIKSKSMETLSVVPTKDGKPYLKGLPYVRIYRKHCDVSNRKGIIPHHAFVYCRASGRHRVYGVQSHSGMFRQ